METVYEVLTINSNTSTDGFKKGFHWRYSYRVGDTSALKGFSRFISGDYGSTSIKQNYDSFRAARSSNKYKKSFFIMKLTDNDKQQIYEYVMSYYSDKIESILTESHELVPNNSRCHFLDYNDNIYAIVLRHTTPRNESPNYYPKPTYYVIYIYPHFKRIGVSDEELYRFMYVLTHFVRFSDTDDKYTKLEFVPEWKTVKLGNEIVPNMSFIDDAETRADMYEYWDEHSEELDKIAFGMRDKIDDYYVRYKPNNPLLAFVRMYHSDYCGVEIVPCRLK